MTAGKHRFLMSVGVLSLLVLTAGCDSMAVTPGPVANDRGEMSDPLTDELELGSENFDNLPDGDM
jgi:hypothetical protein